MWGWWTWEVFEHHESDVRVESLGTPVDLMHIGGHSSKVLLNAFENDETLLCLYEHFSEMRSLALYDEDAAACRCWQAE